MNPPDNAQNPETGNSSQARSLEPGRGIWSKLAGHPGVRRAYIHLPGVLSLKTPFQPRLLGQPLTRSETGFIGEIMAARWLKRHDRKILYRNYRGPQRGEVDIVARHGEVLAFIEVKTRSSTAFGRPADAVNPDKQRLIQRGAQDWLRLLGKPKIAFRFDIVEVLLVPGTVPKVHVIENAFNLPDAAVIGR